MSARELPTSARLELCPRYILLCNALSNATRGRRTDPLWAVVRDLCGVGSTSATEICLELGWDPYQRAGSGETRNYAKKTLT